MALVLNISLFFTASEAMKINIQFGNESITKNVIILAGTSSAGKSMISELLSSRLTKIGYDCEEIHMDKFSDSEVEACDEENAALLTKLNWEAEHLLTLEKIAKLDASIIICDLVLLNIDGTDITKSFVKELNSMGYNVCTILIYCPLEQFLSNIKKRNSLNLHDETRIPEYVFDQFLNLYCSSSQNFTNTTSIKANGQLLLESLASLPFTSQDLQAQERQRSYICSKLSKLFINEQQQINITFASHYDQIFMNDSEDGNILTQKIDKLVDYLTTQVLL